MSDVAVAGVLLAFFIALAITAPIWGFDSRDGVHSDEPARRVAWLHGPHSHLSQAASWSSRVGSASGSRTAHLLRSAASRLEPEVATLASAQGRAVSWDGGLGRLHLHWCSRSIMERAVGD
ncbi:MAG: hypothetical protein IT306_22940 [Chloroflexi bacterium]|nr:hypothetical protein [Chloroflexota bacterium]